MHDYFDLITGQGGGAILAAALAVGIEFDQLAEWWTTDWRKVHNPNPLQKLQRWAVSKIKPNESGFNAKRARKALKKLFSRAKSDLRFKDVLTRLPTQKNNAIDELLPHNWRPAIPDKV